MKKVFASIKAMPRRTWALTGIPRATAALAAGLAKRGWYAAGAVVRHPFLFMGLLLVLWGAHYRWLTATSKLELMAGALASVYVFFFYLAQVRESRALLKAEYPAAGRQLPQ